MPKLACRRARLAGTLVMLAVAAPGTDRRSASAKEPEPLDALAPVEVLASGFRQPSALVVEPTGAVLVTDRAAGTLIRIQVGGAMELLARDLHQPIGVAVDQAGGIFVLEAAARRVLRIGTGGATRIVASTYGRPQAIAAGPDGRIWIAVRGEGAPRNDDVIVRLEESGAHTVVASGFKDVEALTAAEGALYVGMTRLVGERGRRRTTVAQLALRDDGSAGPIEPLLSFEGDRVAGLAVDGLGDLFVGAVPVEHRHGHDGVVLKRHRSGPVTEFAHGLLEPPALAFAPGGDLIALETRHHGRVLRFRAPPAPAPDVPPFTNLTPLPILGRAQAGDRVQLFQPSGPAEALATTIAGVDGAFTVSAALAANARTELLFRATAAGGRGLAGASAAVAVVHDDVLPQVTMLDPAPGVHVRGPVVLRSRGEDEGSGVASVTFLLDDTVVATVDNPDPSAPLLASTVLDTGTTAEGPHALTVAAVDRAGNSRSAAQLVVVDRTPPDTAIVSGPPAVTVERSVRFGVEGTDIWSPALEFSWRLDEGPWSTYSPALVIELNGLAGGPHRFEVRARDLAGNEDPTPAAQTFEVRPLRVRILEPVEGAVISSSSVWVRGTVEGGTGEVSVRVVLPPAFAGTIAAPVEGGSFAIEVPADPAFSTLTIQATDALGAAADASVSVAVAPDGTSEESLELWPPGGVAPLTVRIGLHGFSDVPLSIDVDSDGADEFTGIAAAEDFATTYTRPGVYVPVVRVMTTDGSVLVRRGLVEVYDPVALDARLQAVWAGFKDALRTGDIDAAVRFIVAERRDAWAEYFRALPADVLREVDAIFPTIAAVEVGARGAQYELVIEENGVMLSYAVWFQIDADGRWRLSRF